MNRVSTSELKAGMTFNDIVFVDPCSPLLSPYQALKEEDITRLKKEGVMELSTNGDIVLSSSPEKNGISSLSSYEKELLLIRAKKKYIKFQNSSDPFYTKVKGVGLFVEKNMESLLKSYKSLNLNIIDDAVQNIVRMLSETPSLVIKIMYTKIVSDWTIQHYLHAALYGILFGKALGYSQKNLQDLFVAMLFMNVGMHAISISVRGKNTKLTPEDIKLVKSHPVFSYRVLGKAGAGSIFADLALQHHEAFDGSGYPRGIRGENITEMAMLASICDSYTAMIEPRPYRKILHPSLSVKNLLAQSGKRFKPQMIHMFIKILSLYPIGSFIKLTNGCGAMVIATHMDKPASPILRLMRDGKGNKYRELKFIDLSIENDIGVKVPIYPANLGVIPAEEF